MSYSSGSLDDSPAVIGRNIRKIFRGGRVDIEPVIDVSIEAYLGELTILRGPSGGGKTVIMNILAGFVRPDDGKVIILGKDTSKWSWNEWNRFRRDYISYMPQRSMFISGIKALENILMPIYIRNGDIRSAKVYAIKLAKELGVDNVLDRKIYVLSGGEKRRISLIRCLVNPKPIMLLDEPTSNLDREMADKVIDKILEYKDPDRALIIASHDLNLIGRGDTIYEIIDGKSFKVK